MASPAKKRKLNPDTKKASAPSKGLEYFFAKQRQNQDGGNGGSSTSSKPPSRQDSNSNAGQTEGQLTDEELARKLQAEWDAEARTSDETNATSKAIEQTAAESSVPVNASSERPSGSQTPQPAVSANVALGNSKKTLSLSSAAATEDQVAASIPLDENPLTFGPAQYIPQLQASWAVEGGDASYALLTRCFVLVSSTQSRIKIVDTLVNCIRLLLEGDPSSLLPAVWLATNSISPPYISMELGLGGSAISKALKQVCGLDNRALKTLYDKLGDPGDVAFEAKKKQSFTLRKPKPLTIKGVFQSLTKIAKTQGQGSGDIKQRIVDRLLQDARGGEESRYIVRTLCQHVSLHETAFNALILLTSSSCVSVLSKQPC